MSTIGEAILMVRGGPDEGSSVPLSGGMTMMGRAALNDVVLEEAGVCGSTLVSEATPKAIGSPTSAAATEPL
jgi:hypothetical protein